MSKQDHNVFFVFKHMAPQSSKSILAKGNKTWWWDFTFDMVHLIWIFVQDKFCSWIKVIHRGCDEKDKAVLCITWYWLPRVRYVIMQQHFIKHSIAKIKTPSNPGLFLEKESAQYAVKFSRQIPWWWYPTRKPPSTLSCLQKGQFFKTRRKAYSSKKRICIC